MTSCEIFTIKKRTSWRFPFVTTSAIVIALSILFIVSLANVKEGNIFYIIGILYFMYGILTSCILTVVSIVLFCLLVINNKKHDNNKDSLAFDTPLLILCLGFFITQIVALM